MIGIGSPHGDDQLGWRLAEELARSGRSGVLARAVSTPIDLLDHLDGCDALIVIDACDAGLAPGAVVVHEWPVAIEACGRASSHGLGVDSVLRLAGSLGNLPARVVLIGVQKTRCEPAGASERRGHAGVAGNRHRSRRDSRCNYGKGVGRWRFTAVVFPGLKW